MTMPVMRNRRALTFALLAAAAGGLTVRAQQGGIAERVGEAIDETGRAIRRGVEGAYARTQSRVNAMQVLDRVYCRLHWEKTLTPAALEMEVRPGGVTVLRGVVPDARAKAKAVELARDTTGVVQVVDELSVASAAGPIPAVTPPAPTQAVPEDARP
jgi:hypothetical protein